MSQLLAGKSYIIMGVANHRSIAWGIAESLYRHGAKLIFTYANERLGQDVKKLTATLEGGENFLLVQCDVSNDEDIASCFAKIQKSYPVIHGLVHCVAYSKREELKGEYVNTSREGYLLAQDISVYSLTAVCKAVKPLMKEGGSIVTLSYLGGERVVTNYNVMGVAKAALNASVKYLANDLGQYNIRVNAISAGPIRTLSAKAIGDFHLILKEIEEKAPLKRTTTLEEVGDTTVFLMSDLSRGVTGELIHVDSGYHIVGLK